jgi:hypothetical protein
MKEKKQRALVQQVQERLGDDCPYKLTPEQWSRWEQNCEVAKLSPVARLFQQLDRMRVELQFAIDETRSRFHKLASTLDDVCERIACLPRDRDLRDGLYDHYKPYKKTVLAEPGYRKNDRIILDARGRCAWCDNSSPLDQWTSGRRRWCSDKCKMRAYRARKAKKKAMTGKAKRR